MEINNFLIESLVHAWANSSIAQNFEKSTTKAGGKLFRLEKALCDVLISFPGKYKETHRGKRTKGVNLYSGLK